MGDELKWFAPVEYPSDAGFGWIEFDSLGGFVSDGTGLEIPLMKALRNFLQLSCLSGSVVESIAVDSHSCLGVYSNLTVAANKSGFA
ncbi:hypothetical protein BaRGS_00029522, partial [Batillaria attramentaria]